MSKGPEGKRKRERRVGMEKGKKEVIETYRLC